MATPKSMLMGALGGAEEVRPPALLRWEKYEEACEKRALVPKFARAALEGQVGGDLDLSSQGLGDLQLEALLEDDSLMRYDRIFRWRLRDARLTAAGAAALAPKLPPHSQVLDLSVNDIGLRGVEALSRMMLAGGLEHLRRLDLSANSLRNDAVDVLAGALLACPELVRLDLNYNSFNGCSALGRAVGEHPHLMRLSMHCNFISGEGAAAIFQGVLQNSKQGGRLADVDLAWNCIGDGRSMAAATAISKVLRESTTLYHLDLSYNSLDAAACARIADGLRDNHHLYGLHFVGNAATMDADGFLQPIAATALRVPESSLQGRPSALSFGDPRNGAAGRLGDTDKAGSSRVNLPKAAWSDDDVLRDRDVLEQKTPCWACEGWQRVELVWKVKPGAREPKAVWAFTSLDNFKKGMRLSREARGGAVAFAGARMVPPGCQLQVIYQVDAGIYVPPDAETETLTVPIDIGLQACAELPELDPPYDQEVVMHRQSSKGKGVIEHHLTLRLWTVAVLGGSSQQQPPASCDPVGRRIVLLDGPNGAGPVQMPRVTEAEFRMRTNKRRSKPFFHGFKRESEATLRECFRLDWSRAKVGRIVPEAERAAVQALLERSYRGLLALYRVVSAMGVTGDTGFGVSQIEASSTISEAGLVDSVTRISDVDRFFIAAKVLPVDMHKKDLAVRQDKALVRYQFMELLLRLAHQRFVQTGAAASMAEGLALLLEAFSGIVEGHVGEIESFFNALHTEAVDDVYRRHAATIQNVYRKWSGRMTPPGLAAFMSLSEFQELLELIGAHDVEFPPRKAAVAFRMGMMTQPEENLCSRFQEMTLIEFQHALGAVVFLRGNYVPGRLPELADDFFTHNLAMAASKKLLILAP